MAKETNGDQAFAEVRSGTLFDLDLLNCPVCCRVLSIPIFQCDNGHIACSSCCTKLTNKCPACFFPIGNGNQQCRAVERLVDAIIVPCPNVEHGCTEKFSFGKELAHEKECAFALPYGDVAVSWDVRSGTLSKLDLPDCPVCCHALSIPTFQCDNGHIACSSCCTKLRYKCPACTFPIGNYRCRIMESVVEEIIVPCPNAKHGCTKEFSYGKELIHEKKCGFALCYCPAPNCNYTGMYKNLYSHYDANHKNTSNRFCCGYPHDAWMHISDKILVLQEYKDGPLVVVQCFKEPQGVYVTVNCIAPCVPGVGRFSYHLSYSWGRKTMSFELPEMNRIQKVSFENAEKDFMVVPYYLLGQPDTLKMNLCVRRLDEEKEDE